MTPEQAKRFVADAATEGQRPLDRERVQALADEMATEGLDPNVIVDIHGASEITPERPGAPRAAEIPRDCVCQWWHNPGGYVMTRKIETCPVHEEIEIVCEYCGAATYNRHDADNHYCADMDISSDVGIWES